MKAFARGSNIGHKIVSLVLAVVFMSAQIAYPQAQEMASQAAAPLAASGMSARQEAAAQQNIQGVIDMKNELETVWFYAAEAVPIPPSTAVADTVQAVFYISTLLDLQNMANDVTAHYILTCDIDASATSSWNGGAGFDPIDDFTGIFDGQGYTISSLSINRPAEDYVGLFGSATGSLRNIRLRDAFVSGHDNVGILLGWSGYSGSTISNAVTIGGSVTGHMATGGLAGLARGTVTGSASERTSVYGSNKVGGLLGGSQAAVSNSHATGFVRATEGSAGGLIGYQMHGPVSDSYATGDVIMTSPGYSSVGGLIGFDDVQTTNCYATGNVIGANAVGGLVGLFGGGEGAITGCHATGSVNGINQVGGLVGENRRAIFDSYATGNVAGQSEVGGLAGRGGAIWSAAPTPISGCYTTGLVNGTSYVGGLLGSYGSAGIAGITDSYATHLYSLLDLQLMKYKLDGTFTMMNDIDASDTRNWNGGAGFESIGNAGGAFTGALNGSNHSITGLYINRTGTNAHPFYVGLFGYADTASAISNLTLRNANITGHGRDGIYYQFAGAPVYVGALAGLNKGSILSCSVIDSTANAGGGNGLGLGYYAGSGAAAYAGGFAGWNSGSINGAQSTAAVTARGGNGMGCYLYGANGGDAYAGGLAGKNDGSVTAAVATGAVSAVGGAGSAGILGKGKNGVGYAGGLIGSNAQSGIAGITDSYATHLYSLLDLQLMKYKLDGTFTVMNDIDAFETRNWNNGKGFETIGRGASFTGNLVGQGKTISNLYIYRPAETVTGLIGYNRGTISGVNLVSAVIRGLSAVGALAGQNFGTIASSRTGGTVAGSSASNGAWIGGLAGVNRGTIAGSSSSAAVSGYTCVGGLVGWGSGTATASRATGNVTGTYYVGGFIGANYGNIYSSVAEGTVSGYSVVGGLAGGNWGLISRCAATGRVYGTYWVGKLVGYNKGTIIY